MFTGFRGDRLRGFVFGVKSALLRGFVVGVAGLFIDLVTLFILNGIVLNVSFL